MEQWTACAFYTHLIKNLNIIADRSCVVVKGGEIRMLFNHLSVRRCHHQAHVFNTRVDVLGDAAKQPSMQPLTRALHLSSCSRGTMKMY